jgi:hypothetical protein
MSARSTKKPRNSGQADVFLEHVVVGVPHRGAQPLEVPPNLTRHRGERVAERMRVDAKAGPDLEAVEHRVDAGLVVRGPA